MQTKTLERYFFFGILLVTFIFSFLIFRPFWTVLVLGISFSVVLYPLYEWLSSRKVPSALASLLVVLVFTALLLGPIFGIGALIFDQSKNVYHLFADQNNSFPILDSINTTVNDFLPKGISINVHEKAAEFVSYLSSNIATIFSTTVSAFFSLLLMLLIIFYFLKDGSEWRKTLVLLSPLSDNEDKKIIDRLSDAINSVVMGSLLIATIQGILMGIGLWLVGIPNPALWGLVAAITSLIPTIGTSLVSLPAIFFLLFNGATTAALGLLIWAGVVVGLVDNFLSPQIISSKTNMSPLFILFSVMGGISLVGPAGILVGPLAISLLYTLISIYRDNFNAHA